MIEPMIIGRDSPLWDRAWAALMATGRDPADGWMLMCAERAAVPGGFRFAFKNHSLPFMPDDPAYDGRGKYVFLPEPQKGEAMGEYTWIGGNTP